MDARLLKTQKNDVFQVLRKGGLDPLQFEWSTTNTPGGPGIAPSTISVLRPTANPEFYFRFNSLHGSYFPACSPWQDARSASLGEVSWGSCLAYVQAWGQMVKAELEIPDLWEALPNLAANSDIAVAAGVSNTKFSPHETTQLAKGINEIKRLLIDAVGESREQAALINDRMQSLLDASKHMGRKDWVALAIGTILTLGLEHALPSETVRQAFKILGHTLTGIVHLVPHVIASAQQLL